MSEAKKVVLKPEAQLKDADFNRMSNLEKSFKFFKRVNDPRFGEVSIIQNPASREFLAVVEKKINDRTEAAKAILAVRERVSLANNNLITLKDYSVKKESQLCSSFYVIKLFFEYPRSDLKKEVIEREKKGEGFDHVDLTHILYQQINALDYLGAKDKTHGDIQPIMIGYDRETNNTKLIDRIEEPFVAAKTKTIQKAKLMAGGPIYQSPTMYTNLKKGNLTFPVDLAKEDSFALGLVLLESGLGKSVQNIYDNSKGTFNEQNLSAHIDEFSKKYSDDNALLSSSVEGLLLVDESARPSPHEVQNTLPPYDHVKSFLVRGSSTVIEDQQSVTHAPEIAPVSYNLFDINNDNISSYSMKSQPQTPSVQSTQVAQYTIDSNIPPTPKSSQSFSTRPVLTEQNPTVYTQVIKTEVPVSNYTNTVESYRSSPTVVRSAAPVQEVPQTVFLKSNKEEPKVYYTSNNNDFFANDNYSSNQYYPSQPSQRVYTQAPQEYKSTYAVNIPVYQSSPSVVRSTQEVPSVTKTSTVVPYSGPTVPEGLVLIKTYMDPSRATDRPNY